MKKLFCILFSLVFVLLIFSACGKNDDTQQETTPSETTTPEPTKKDYNFGNGITINTLKKKSSYTVFEAPEGDYRKAVVDYMMKMATIEWKAAEDFTIQWRNPSDKDYTVNIPFKKGQTYYGVPYGQTKAGFDEFLEYVKDDIFESPSYYYDDIIGNHCSSSMFLAFQQVIPVEYGTFRPTEARKGIFKLAGELEKPEGATWYSKDVHKLNGTKKTFEAYASMGPGDILFKCIAGSGHTRLVNRVETVYKTNGEIDHNKSYVYTIEQTNALDTQLKKNTTWWVDHKYSFADLYVKEFMPITADVFHNGAESLDAFISMSGKNTPEKINDALTGTINSNFPINYVRITIKDPQGNIKSAFTVHNISNLYTYKLANMYTVLGINKLPAGNYTYTLRAGIARGACTLESFEFTVE